MRINYREDTKSGIMTIEFEPQNDTERAMVSRFINGAGPFHVRKPDIEKELADAWFIDAVVGTQIRIFNPEPEPAEVRPLTAKEFVQGKYPEAHCVSQTITAWHPNGTVKRYEYAVYIDDVSYFAAYGHTHDEAWENAKKLLDLP